MLSGMVSSPYGEIPKGSANRHACASPPCVPWSQYKGHPWGTENNNKNIKL